jgi:hypothetical protein
VAKDQAAAATVKLAAAKATMLAATTDQAKTEGVEGLTLAATLVVASSHAAQAAAAQELMANSSVALAEAVPKAKSAAAAKAAAEGQLAAAKVALQVAPLHSEERARLVTKVPLLAAAVANATRAADAAAQEELARSREGEVAKKKYEEHISLSMNVRQLIPT